MRVGTNPNRSSLAHQYTDVVLSVVTHLPNFTGYHAKRLEVVQTCLETMRDNSGGDYTVIVWDNGSCEEFRQWVRDEYKPDMFVQSTNIGKTLARNSLASMLPKGKIIAFCDDDILFYKNWLNPQLSLLRGFPNVSCVTGYPVRTAFRWGVENTKSWAVKHGKMRTGRFIPTEWENDFAVSIGRDPTQHKAMTLKDMDCIVEYKGLEAYTTSHHCQFVGYAERIAQANKFDGVAMGEERSFDINLDNLGLRLATIERYTRHIGNVIHDELRGEIDKARKP